MIEIVSKDPFSSYTKEGEEVEQMVKKMNDKDKMQMVQESLREMIKKWNISLEFLIEHTSFSSTYLRAFINNTNQEEYNYSYKFVRLVFLAVEDWMKNAEKQIPNDADEVSKLKIFLARGTKKSS